MIWRPIAATCLAAVATHAVAQGAIDLTRLDRHMTGSRAQVLVLGTVHLSEQGKAFKPAALDPVLDKLARFHPDIVTIEAIPGESCDLAARHPSVYGADFCPDTIAATTATGLEVPAAIAAVNKALASWPAMPTAAERRHLAALFLAANEPASAYVQWLQLPAAERQAGDDLTEPLIALLQKMSLTANENYLIGARLAARLGLQRVFPVDDHSGDNINVADEKAFGAALQEAWDTGKARLTAITSQEQRLAQGDDLLPLYRYINRPANLAAMAELNVDTAMRAASPQRYPQIWVAGWETRNLRMVANIRATFRERPGARVLCIVGLSHKPWFDSWLGQLQGVDIVDTLAVLK